MSPWDQVYWVAFARLGRFRHRGMMGDPLPIEEEAMRRWAAEHGPDGADALDEFVTIIGRLDDVWLAHSAEKQKKQ